MADELPKAEELINGRSQSAGETTGWTRRSTSAKACTATRPIPRAWNTWGCPTPASGTRWKKTGSCRKTGSRSCMKASRSAWTNSAASRSSWTSACAAGPARQVPLFHRHRRPQEHAGAAGRTAALGLPQRFHHGRKALGRLAGARPMTVDVFKEWWYYLFQCTECRRCSVFCPYGIDTAEITIIGRELLNLLGLNIDWIATPVANCYRTGNHLGIQPHAFKDMLDFFVTTSKRSPASMSNPTSTKRGRHPFYHAFRRRVRRPGHLHLHGVPAAVPLPEGKIRPGCHLEHLCLRRRQLRFLYLPRNHEAVERQDVHAEAKRLGVKWILGGECGHMWRVIHQYMDTMNGPADFLEEPVNPITGTVSRTPRPPRWCISPSSRPT
jgi:hypothetical protein